MEAVAALGLVSSIISIAQFTAELASGTAKLLSAAGDALPENEWIEDVANRSRDFAQGLDAKSSTIGPMTKIDTAVTKLAARCLEAASDLTASLQELKVPPRSGGTKSKWTAAKAMYKSMLRSGTLKKKHNELERLERQLAALLLLAIQRSQLNGFDELRELVERNGRDCVAVVRSAVQESLNVLVNKLSALQLEMNSVRQGVARIEQSQLNAIEKQRVEDLMYSLAYSSMKSRKEMIADPVGSSYDWAFEDDSQPTKQWLGSSVTHCWITGEPGSGKSVFTKSFRLDRRTLRSLQSHAGGDNLIVLDHYFWISGGDPQQRSLRAMLQNLCYQALQQHGELAEIAFSDEWSSRMSSRGKAWTTNELVLGLENITSAPGYRTCIFIDGLDECENKELSELNRALLKIARMANARLCISSRPWDVFEKAFSSWTRLKLPENSAWDIFRLICTRLADVDQSFQKCSEDTRLFDIITARKSHSVWYEKTVKSFNDSERLIHDLCTKADGNMLWTTVILGTVCERVDVGHNLTKLAQFIDDLPADLERYYYDLVYSRIHDTYKTKNGSSECAMALKMSQLASSGWNCYKSIWVLQSSIRTRTGVAYDDDFAKRFQWRNSAIARSQQSSEQVRKFLDSRCKDLFVTHWVEEQLSPRWPDVQYQHRVIHDFLRSDRMQSEVDANVPSHFRETLFGFEMDLIALRIRMDHLRLSLENGNQPGIGVTELFIALKITIDQRILLYQEDFGAPLEQAVAKLCDETVETLLRLLVEHGDLQTAMDLDGEFFPSWVYVQVFLVQRKRFESLSFLIELSTREGPGHINVARPGRRDARLGSSGGIRARQPVSIGEQTCQDCILTPGTSKTVYLPVKNSLWTSFVAECQIQWRDLSESFDPLLLIVAKQFLEAGASTEVEICWKKICHGPFCVCPDPLTHSGLYECPTPSRHGHEHKWRRAKDILLERFEFTDAELTQFFTSTEEPDTNLAAEQIRLAIEVDTEWRELMRQEASCIELDTAQHTDAELSDSESFDIGSVMSQGATVRYG